MYKLARDVDSRKPDLIALDEGGGADDERVPVARPIEYLFAPAENVPNETLVETPDQDAPERAIRYERGSTVYAIDGPVGSLRQLVIDEDVAEIKALVVRMTAKDESVLMPPELVDKCVGKTILLNVTKEQFAKGASRSPRFDPKMFTGADAKAIAAVIPLAFLGNKQRSVVSISREAVQTSEVLEPTTQPQTPPSDRPWWKRLGRSRQA
jgi:hypothetical protein